MALPLVSFYRCPRVCMTPQSYIDVGDIALCMTLIPNPGSSSSIRHAVRIEDEAPLWMTTNLLFKDDILWLK